MIYNHTSPTPSLENAIAAKTFCSQHWSAPPGALDDFLSASPVQVLGRIAQGSLCFRNLWREPHQNWADTGKGTRSVTDLINPSL